MDAKSASTGSLENRQDRGFPQRPQPSLFPLHQDPRKNGCPSRSGRRVSRIRQFSTTVDTLRPPSQEITILMCTPGDGAREGWRPCRNAEGRVTCPIGAGNERWVLAFTGDFPRRISVPGPSSTDSGTAAAAARWVWSTRAGRRRHACRPYSALGRGRAPWPRGRSWAKGAAGRNPAPRAASSCFLRRSLWRFHRSRSCLTRVNASAQPFDLPLFPNARIARILLGRRTLRWHRSHATPSRIVQVHIFGSGPIMKASPLNEYQLG